MLENGSQHNAELAAPLVPPRDMPAPEPPSAAARWWSWWQSAPPRTRFLGWVCYCAVVVLAFALTVGFGWFASRTAADGTPIVGLTCRTTAWGECGVEGALCLRDPQDLGTMIR